MSFKNTKRHKQLTAISKKMTLPHQNRSLTLVSLLNFQKFRFSFKKINDKWSIGFTGNSDLKSDLQVNWIYRIYGCNKNLFVAVTIVSFHKSQFKKVITVLPEVLF